MKFALNCMKGIVIGAGAILPGISSGVLCVVMGIYEKLLDSALNFFKDVKKNGAFLLPIIVGIGIGIFLFSNILKYLLITFPLLVKTIFIVLILGSIPSLKKEVDSKCKFQFKYYYYSLIAFFIGIITVILEKNIIIENINNINFIYLLLSGMAMSVGIVVPGVSSTLILMLLGIYSTYLTAISSLYLPVLIPMGIGIAIGCFIFMKITKYLLENYYAQAFYAIMGFTLGSVIVIFS